MTLTHEAVEGHSRGMAGTVRVEYPGAIYHVMHHGDRRELIFQVDADGRRFIETLIEACVKTGWKVHTSSGRRYA